MLVEEPDFRQLKMLWTLKAVVEGGSVKQAASRTRVSSSAVSQAVSALERKLGRRLVLRRAGKLVPTQYCDQILKSAAPAFAAWSTLQRDLAPEHPALPKLAWLTFGATECTAIEVLPGIIRRLREKFPAIRINARSGRSAELTSMVKRGELCMALVAENGLMEGLSVIPMAEERLGVYISAREPIARLGWGAVSRLGVAALSGDDKDGYPEYFRRFLRIFSGTTPSAGNATAAPGQAGAAAVSSGGSSSVNSSAFRPTISSGSYEALRVAASDGVVAAILPTRVAARRSGELVEIMPPTAELRKAAERGRYRICLVSEASCDPAETLFLGQELRALISAGSP